MYGLHKKIVKTKLFRGTKAKKQYLEQNRLALAIAKLAKPQACQKQIILLYC